MNKNVPSRKVYIRNEYLYDHQKGHCEFTQALLLSVKAVKGRALQFSVLLETGALFSGLPVSALSTVKNSKDFLYELGELQPWDCLCGEIDVFTIDTLRNINVDVRIRDVLVSGNYWFTIDYIDQDSLAGTPDEWKYAHLIALENGQFCLQPNNRVLWIDKSFCTLVDKLDYKVNTRVYVCENRSDHVERDMRYFY